MTILSSAQAWVLRRALAGLDWPGISVDSLTETLARSAQKHRDANLLAQFFGPAALTEILSANPDQPPAPPTPARPEIFVPPLPAYAQLSDNALRLAELTRNSFVDRATSWAATLAPMTPRSFLESGALWLVGLAVAGRAAWHIHKPIYPQIYVLWVAVTSRYKKTTGALAILRLGLAAFPWMFFPEETTPEAFIGAMAGRRPSNYDKLGAYDKTMIDKAVPHAAQRGMFIDEISSLLGAAKSKDYQQGMEEAIMRGFDAAPIYRRLTQSDGYTVVRNPQLSIIGQTTPAALARNVRPEDWETGLMARFVTLSPEGKPEYQLPELTPAQARPPIELVNRLVEIYQALPQPPNEIELAGDVPPERKYISALCTKEAMEAFQAYSRALTFDLLEDGTNQPDERLHGNYSRLHEYAAKVALIFALDDWLKHERETPLIELGHWARAQQIVEGWRVSLHRLIDQLDSRQECKDADRILGLIARTPPGMTKREISISTHLPYKIIEVALEMLTESGEIEVAQRENNRRATVYRTIKTL